MELLYMVVGLIIIYSFLHVAFLQKKAYGERTTYEKIVTIVAGVSLVLLVLSIMQG